MRYALIFSLILLLGLPLLAYRNTGFEQVDANSLLKKADRLGLGIASQERKIKKELLKVKKSNKAEFDRRKDDKLANPDFYNGYFLEIEGGLSQVEKAKKIAKAVLYKKFEENWNDLKLTAINTLAEKDFKKYQEKLVKDLNQMVFVKGKAGYNFEVGQWAYMTVARNFKGVTWRIEFSSKYDNNQLEKGAADIQIDKSSGSSPDTKSEDLDF